MTPLILASASPRRLELLQRVGLTLEVRPANIDETVLPGEAPLAYVARLAAAKADVVFATAPGRSVLGADTIVEIDGVILGKAESQDEALAMLRRLAGRTHRVSTAFSLRGPGLAVDRLVTTDVDMSPASPDELAEYVSAGEWRGKAGAYAVQGMAAALVTQVRGSVTNVIGLPLAEVLAELRRSGAALSNFTRGVPA